jgi:hypothetical protein
MGARSRVKGAAWQAELARRWRESGLWPLAASTQGAQTRSGRGIGITPPDVEGTPFAVETKHEKRANPIAALVQSEREAGERGDARPAIAVVRPHGSGPEGAVVIMKLPVFELLAEAAQAGFTMADLLEVRRKTRASALDVPRCKVCNWPLAASVQQGCVPGNCSYRPSDPQEQARVRERREALSSQGGQVSTYRVDAAE